jgi:hypothetical protein
MQQQLSHPTITVSTTLVRQHNPRAAAVVMRPTMTDCTNDSCAAAQPPCSSDCRVQQQQCVIRCLFPRMHFPTLSPSLQRARVADALPREYAFPAPPSLPHPQRTDRAPGTPAERQALPPCPPLSFSWKILGKAPSGGQGGLFLTLALAVGRAGEREQSSAQGSMPQETLRIEKKKKNWIW